MLRQVRTKPVQRTTAHSLRAHLLKEIFMIYVVKSFCKIWEKLYEGTTPVKIIVYVLQCVNDRVRGRNIFPETELIFTDQIEMYKEA